jgi:CRISPR-associated endonuclease/helicase Cas3
MNALNAERFEDFFKELNGSECKPFPWQLRLAQRVIGTADQGGNWPQVMALPTASGKTACLDIAVFALAYQAHLPEEKRTAPRRIFFVVDRRVVVDEAFRRAEKISKKLAEADSGILREVADALRSLNLDPESARPLECYRLRGGVRREDEWSKDPLQPAIITSTVDQYGSRLLFRGYGVSRSMHPIHAALTGNDSLVVLDEAHCARPFSETLASIERYRSWSEISIGTPFEVVLMSATPPPGCDDIIGVNADDLSDPVLWPRLSVPKPTNLIEAEKAKGKGALRLLAEKLADQAVKMKGPSPKAIAVIVNRVPTARYVNELLRLKTKGDVVLVTGRMRPIDRDDTADEWFRRLDATISKDRQLERDVFVVSTQCLEVGANLDFDCMVSECASLDAVRQRFGRLNRMGRPIEARGAVVIRSDQTEVWKEQEDEDPIYGNALPLTWKWLNRSAKDGQVDMGFLSLSKEMEPSNEDLEMLNAPAPDAPIVLPAYLDCWVQTWPEPSPDPEVSAFLHGPERGLADIEVCWRADLDEEQPDDSIWIETVSLCPPTPSELMPVPPGVFRRWFAGAESPDRELTDTEGAATRVNETEPAKKIRGLVWRGPNESFMTNDPGSVLPGDVVVLSASSKGWETLGHVPKIIENLAEVDRADEAKLISGASPILRLHPATVSCWPESPSKKEIMDLISTPDLVERFGELDFEAALTVGLRDLMKEESAPKWLREDAEILGQRKHAFRMTIHPTGKGLVLRASRPNTRRYGDEQNSLGVGEDSNAYTAPSTLKEHSEHARHVAEQYGIKLLPSDLRGPVSEAAHLHDLGKADRRFQALLHGGDLRAANAARELLAKSDWSPDTRTEYEKARIRSGYPSGGRHELLSVKLAEQIENDNKEQDLTLHLIASHHGRCRPFAPTVYDPDPPDVTLMWNGSVLGHSGETGLGKVDSAIADRFWTEVRRHGWWGEAYLEMLTRLADHRSSEDGKANRPKGEGYEEVGQ